MHYKDELYHYGVRGMRWGHRKQIEEDGKSDRRKRVSRIVKGTLIATGITALTITVVKNKDKIISLGKKFIGKNKQKYEQVPFEAITRPAIQKPTVKRPVGRPLGSKSYAKFNAWEWNTKRGYKFMMHEIYKK